LDCEGRTIWIVAAHGYGNRFIVRSDEILTAFLKLDRAAHEFAVSVMLESHGGFGLELGDWQKQY